MGWLGYTEREALDTSIPAIETAYEGLVEKLRLIQQGQFVAVAGEPPAEPVEQRKPSGQAIFAVLRQAASPAHAKRVPRQ